jgi:hypothetical protein
MKGCMEKLNVNMEEKDLSTMTWEEAIEHLMKDLSYEQDEAEFRVAIARGRVTLYNPAKNPNVSFEDAVSFLVREFGFLKERAEFSVAMMRGENPGVREEILEDGTVLVHHQ